MKRVNLQNGKAQKEFTEASKRLPAEAASRERWYWLDWLRVLSIGAIFLFHSSAPFSYFPWDVMNQTPSLWLTIFGLFILGWVMPLFFVISGISAFFSLSRRTTLEYTKERVQRLLIPFTFGLLVILSTDTYYRAVFNGSFNGSFLSYYTGPYFKTFFPFNLDLSPTYLAGFNQGIYLWYLFWLFVFSLFTGPFFKWITRPENRGLFTAVSKAYRRRCGLLLLAVPLIIVNLATVPPYFISNSLISFYGGWKLPTYLVFFVTAYILANDPQLGEALNRDRKPALLLGVVTSILAIGSSLLTAADPTDPSKHYLTLSTFQALNGWCWVVAILGYGRKHLSFNSKFLETSNELVLPFYVLHQSVIVAVAYYLLGLNMVILEKFMLIVILSFPTIATLLLPISKINALRFLFGMKPKPKKVIDR